MNMENIVNYILLLVLTSLRTRYPVTEIDNRIDPFI